MARVKAHRPTSLAEVTTVAEWVQFGIDNCFCSPVACGTHDGTPMTEEEIDQFEEGLDPCMPVTRIWE